MMVVEVECWVLEARVANLETGVPACSDFVIGFEI